MTQKERLVELLKSVPTTIGEIVNDQGKHWGAIVSNSVIADHLLSNGVIVPPCKVGDTVYSIGWFDATVKEEKILYFIYYSYSNNFVFVTDVGYFDANQIGKFIFLTRQAADQSLKERET